MNKEKKLSVSSLEWHYSLIFGNMDEIQCLLLAPKFGLIIFIVLFLSFWQVRFFSHHSICCSLCLKCSRVKLVWLAPFLIMLILTQSSLPVLPAPCHSPFILLLVIHHDEWLSGLCFFSGPSFSCLSYIYTPEIWLYIYLNKLAPVTWTINV